MVNPFAKHSPLPVYTMLIASLLVVLLSSNPYITDTAVARATHQPMVLGFNCQGTRFFESTPVGTRFNVGDVWQGGHFSFIENNNTMVVGNPVHGITVGRFPQPQRRGGVAQIDFDRTIKIVAILWFDNDPKQGEDGWSINEVHGPWLPEKEWQWTLEDMRTRHVQIQAGQDTGGVDFCFEEVSDTPISTEPDQFPNVQPELEIPPQLPDLRSVPIPVMLPDTGPEQRRIPAIILIALLLWSTAALLHRTRMKF